MMATEARIRGGDSPFSETFKQQSGRLFSLDSLVDAPSKTTKGRSQFLSSTGKSDTISAHRKAERGSEDAGISQRNAALEDVKEHVVSLDDILELFARGGAGELSVFFCKSPDQSVDFRPYDLVVYPPSQPTPPLDPEYYTVTPSGVLHVRKGEASVLIPLAAWIRERTLFTFLRRIAFFKHYILIRCFTRWHKTTRRLLFQRVRASIGKQLLTVRPQFRKALHEVRGHVDAMEHAPMLALGPPMGGGAWQLVDFRELQADVRERQFQRQLLQASTSIQQTVEGVIAEVDTRLQGLQEAGVEQSTRTREKERRSLALVRQEHQEHARQCKLAKRDHASLGAMLRLVDYWMTHALYMRTLTAATDFISALRPADMPDFEGLFMTSVAFRPEGRVLMPDLAAAKVAVNESILNAALDVAQAIPRPLGTRAFAPHFQGRPTSLHLPTLMGSMAEYKAARDRIDEIIAGDYAAAESYAVVFDPLRKVFDFGTSWNFQEWSNEPRSVREMRRELRRHAEWRGEISAMKTGATLGALHLEANTLKAALNPITVTAQTQVKGLVLSQAREAASRGVNDMRSLTAALTERDTRLGAFCEFMVLHEEQVAAKQTLLQAAAEADDMFELLLQHRDKLTPGDQVLRDDLIDVAEAYVAALRGAKDHIAASKQQQLDAWTTQAQAIQRGGTAIAAELQNSKPLRDPEAAAHANVEKITEISARLLQLREEADVLEQMRGTLGTEVLDWGPLQLAESLLGQLQAIWTTLRDLDLHLPDWVSTTILDPSTGRVALDAEAIQAEVRAASLAAESCAEAGHAVFGPATALLQDRVGQAQALLRLLLPVISPALRDRHWSQILGLLESGPRSDGLDQFNLDDLLKAGLEDHLEEVAGIADTAAQEQALEQALAAMEAAWGEVRLLVAPPPEAEAGARAPTPQLQEGATTSIKAFIEEQADALTRMGQSPYVQPIIAQVAAWQATLAAIGSTVDSLAATEADWTSLQQRHIQLGRGVAPEAAESLAQAQAAWSAVLIQAGEAPSVLALVKAQEWGQQLDAVAALILLERAKLPPPRN